VIASACSWRDEAFLPIEPVDSVQSGRLAMLTQQCEQPG
jgi:hypothetical protein